MEFDLKDGFTLLTTREMFVRGMFAEALFFLRGQTNTQILSDQKVRVWEKNTSKEFLNKVGLSHYEERDLGASYGFQLRHFGSEYRGMNENYSEKGFDQLEYIVNEIKKDMYSRRIIGTVFNPAQAKLGVLYPCTGIVLQFYVDGSNRLCFYIYIRSSDLICGLPWNIGFYGMILLIVLELVNNAPDYNGPSLEAGKLIISLGDYHIYDAVDHINAVKEHLVREPYKFCSFGFKRKIVNLDDLQWGDVNLVNYKRHPKIDVEMIA